MKSVLQAVLQHAEARPEAVAFHWLSSRAPAEELRWAQLVNEAERGAAELYARGVRAGDPVVLVGSHHPRFPGAWLGATWIGAVPTVLAEPGVRIHASIYSARMAALLERIDAKALMLDPRLALEALRPKALPIVDYDSLSRSAAPAIGPREPAADELLLLQHSSGTTGLQKGVMLTHGAVMEHASAHRSVTGLTSNDTIASWLPLYHDMGLISCFVAPLIEGASVAWLSPLEWVAAPGTLLDAIERFGATHCWLPNFAFAFLAARVRRDRPRRMGSLRQIVNCSETVTAASMDAFAERFSTEGVRREALSACYAMAENVFGMTATAPGEEPRRRRSDRDRFESSATSTPPNPGGKEIVHVSSGKALPGVEVRITDSEGRPLVPDVVGRILIRSPFLFSGYYRRPELDAGLLDGDGFFDTGDLGFLDGEGELFVTGRKKDLIIVGGRNLYPVDLEVECEKVYGIVPGRTVAFGVPVRASGTEGVVILAETREPESAHADLARSLRKALATGLEVDAIDVKVVPHQALRKSTSGKLARASNREWYLEGRFGVTPASIDVPSS